MSVEEELTVALMYEVTDEAIFEQWVEYRSADVPGAKLVEVRYNPDGQE